MVLNGIPLTDFCIKTGQVGDVKPLFVNEGQGNNVIHRIVD